MNPFESNWLEQIITDGLLSLTRQYEKSLPQNNLSRDYTTKSNQSLKVNLIATGILSLSPTNSQGKLPRILLSSGIHGNETAPMEILDNLLMRIFEGECDIHCHLMIMIGNPPAVNIGKRFVEQNLNRLFNGEYKKVAVADYECERAEEIEKAVENFFGCDETVERHHLDLHTAIRASKYEKFVVYPYLDGRPWDKDHIAFFGGADITTVLLGDHPAGTFSYYTSHQFKAKAATVELGKVRPFGKNIMSNFSGIAENIERLVSSKPLRLLPYSPDSYTIFKVKQDITKVNEEFRLLVEDDVKNFTSFSKGHLLASDGKQENYRVESDGEAIVFPNNNVPVGQRVGVLLEPTSL